MFANELMEKRRLAADEKRQELVLRLAKSEQAKAEKMSLVLTSAPEVQKKRKKFALLVLLRQVRNKRVVLWEQPFLHCFLQTVCVRAGCRALCLGLGVAAAASPALFVFCCLLHNGAIICGPPWCVDPFCARRRCTLCLS
jgi:hypothetical protein